MTIHIFNDNPLIGDALGSYPFMLHFARTEKVYVTGPLNQLVKDLVDASNLIYAEPPEAVNQRSTLHPMNSMRYCSTNRPNTHMAQGYFGQFQLAIPPLPMRVPFKETEIEETADIVIAPFSFSDAAYIKRWPQEKWIQFIKHFSPAHKVYIVGGPIDDASWAIEAGAHPFLCHPLSDVYALLKRAKVVVTVDTSISHMCHFGGISHHVLLFPNTLPRGFAETPIGVQVKGPSNTAISVEEVIAATNQFLI